MIENAEPIKTNLKENTIQSEGLTLEFIGNDDKNRESLEVKTKVHEILTQMYVRAKKLGRPKREKENEAA